MNRPQATASKVANRGFRLSWWALGLIAIPAAAQSSHAVSIQASGVVINSSNLPSNSASGTKLGWEGQLRVALGRTTSLGFGYEQALVFKESGVVQGADLTETLQLGFVEPRLVVGVLGSSAAVYLAARIGAGKVKCEPAACSGSGAQLALGGGGGVLIHLGGAAALDLGVQFFQFASSGTARFVFLRGGLSVGL